MSPTPVVTAGMQPTQVGSTVWFPCAPQKGQAREGGLGGSTLRRSGGLSGCRRQCKRWGSVRVRARAVRRCPVLEPVLARLPRRCRRRYIQPTDSYVHVHGTQLAPSKQDGPGKGMAWDYFPREKANINLDHTLGHSRCAATFATGAGYCLTLLLKFPQHRCAMRCAALSAA